MNQGAQAFPGQVAFMDQIQNRKENKMGIIDGKTICQVALVVKDLDKTVEEYAKHFQLSFGADWSLMNVSKANDYTYKNRSFTFSLGYIL